MAKQERTVKGMVRRCGLFTKFDMQYMTITFHPPLQRVIANCPINQANNDLACLTKPGDLVEVTGIEVENDPDNLHSCNFTNLELVGETS